MFAPLPAFETCRARKPQRLLKRAARSYRSLHYPRSHTALFLTPNLGEHLVQVVHNPYLLVQPN